MGAKTRTRAKPKDPQVAAAERRKLAFEAVGLQRASALLPSNDDMLAETAVRQQPGQRGNVDRVRRLSGLDWLWQKERLQAHQMQAGLKYGDDYRKANDVSLRSGIAEARGGDPDAGQHKRMEAFDRLQHVQRAALLGHQQMIDLCNAVAGEGTRVTTISKGDDTLSRQLEAVLLVALDLLAINYGMLKT